MITGTFITGFTMITTTSICYGRPLKSSSAAFGSLEAFYVWTLDGFEFHIAELLHI